MKGRRIVVVGVLAVAVLFGLVGCDWFLAPVIPIVQTLGFAPQAGAVHTLVTVVGEGFGSSPGDGAVTFGEVEAVLETWSNTNIVVRVPVLATPTGQRSATVEVHKSGALLGMGTFTVLRGVLFETHRDGNSEIYVMNPDGTQPINLTDDSGRDTSAVWSPDGTKIAFETRRDGNSEIYVMGADGSNPTNLTNHPDSDHFPAWSPHGGKIAFMSNRENTGPPILDVTPKIIIGFNVEIFVMNEDGTGQTNLTNHVAWDGYPSWSPDGSKIVFQSYRDGNAEIYAMNTDGTGQTRLTNHPDPDSMPTWSPDGGWITFHSYRDGNPEIYKMTATGASVTRLTNSSDLDWGPSWSPDGSQIAFQSSRDGNSEIYSMDADGSHQQRLTNTIDLDLRPFWGTFGWMPPG